MHCNVKSVIFLKLYCYIVIIYALDVLLFHQYLPGCGCWYISTKIERDKYLNMPWIYKQTILCESFKNNKTMINIAVYIDYWTAAMNIDIDSIVKCIVSSIYLVAEGK